MNTAQDQQSREAYKDGKWYWVEHEGWHGEPPTIAPACYKAECDAWYSYIFSGISTPYLKVLGPCELQAARALPAPENVREGEPYDNPPFEDLARTMGVWGTAQAALCAQFFIAGRGAVLEGMEPVAWIDLATWPPIRWPAGKVRADFRDIDGMALYTAAQVQAMGRVPPGWQAVPVEPTEEMARAFRADDAPHYFVMTTLRCADFGERYRAALAAAPRPPAAQKAVIGPCGQCKDARQPCQCSLDTILKERGLVAVNRESFQHMVTKIAAASAPACWCECCDTVANSGFRSRMSLCPKCGDKRCPRAYHHNSDCSAP